MKTHPFSPLPAASYEVRRFSFVELWRHEGWSLKVYGITRHDGGPRPELITAAKHRAASFLAEAPPRSGFYGVGFLGIHEGLGANFVFLDRWADVNELHHEVWIASAAAPTTLRDATADDPSVCCYDLHVQGFERQAWVECVLSGGGLDAYLERTLDGEA